MSKNWGMQVMNLASSTTPYTDRDIVNVHLTLPWQRCILPDLPKSERDSRDDGKDGPDDDVHEDADAVLDEKLQPQCHLCQHF